MNTQQPHQHAVTANAPEARFVALAGTAMAMQNLLLAAHAAGLGANV